MKKTKAVVVGVSALNKHLQALQDSRNHDYEKNRQRGEVIIRAATGNPLVWRELKVNQEALTRLIRETAKRRVIGLLSYLETNNNIPAEYRQADSREILHIMEMEKLTYGDVGKTEASFLAVVRHKIHHQ